MSRGGAEGGQTRFPVQRPDKPHFLQHVPVVVDPRLVDAKADRHALLKHVVDRGDATGQAQSRAGIVADRAAAFPDKIKVFRIGPDAVTKREVAGQTAQVRQMPDRRLAIGAACVFRLQPGFHQMHVDL